MKTTIASLLLHIKQSLLPTLQNDILCEQYARWLLESILDVKEANLISTQHSNWSAENQKKLQYYIDQLTTNHMPLQYLLGSTPFVNLDVLCKPPILIPRPETEEWCITLIQQLHPLRNQPLQILDLCTGTGCIALALAQALPKATVYGTDISNHAINLAQENALHNYIANATFFQSDLFSEISSSLTFDLIVSNPPYIPAQDWPTLDKSVSQWEDKNALIADDNGLALIKKIIANAPCYLRENKPLKTLAIPQLIVEIDHTHGKLVADYLHQCNYTLIKITQDLSSKDRVASGRVDNVDIPKNKS